MAAPVLFGNLETLKYQRERENLSFNPIFPSFYIGDGRIASSMAVYHILLLDY